MSGNDEFVGANVGQELSAPDIISAEDSSIMASSSISMGSSDKHSPPTASKVDNPINTELEMEEDIEAVIEKKLSPDKEKALDIDSELDFELKWDDDAEINALSDDESIMATDEVTLDGKSDNAQSSTAEKETVDKLIESKVSAEQIDENDKNILDATPLDVTDKENIVDNASDDENVFKLETKVKFDLASKFMDSENNSLDECLVYSDVDVPEIEDKELLDEIDAQISDTEKKSNDENSDEDASQTLVPVDQKEPNVGGIQTSQPDHNRTEMDVDDNNSFDKSEKVGLNDTCSTIVNMETSSYEINMEHKLGKPDAMIEIPTQELIEGLDDSGELSEGVELYDEELLLGNDAEPKIISSDSNKEIENTANHQVKSEEPSVKEVITNASSSPDVEDKVVDMIKGTNDTHITENEPKLSSYDKEQKQTLEATKSNDNILCQDLDMNNEESSADIIFEASHIELDKLTYTKDNNTNDLVSEDLKPNNSPFLDDLESEITTEVDSVYAVVDKGSKYSDTSALTGEITNIVDVVSKINTAEALEPMEVIETEETTSPNVLESNKNTGATDISSPDNKNPGVENVTNIITKITIEGNNINSVAASEPNKATETDNTISSSILKDREANKISSTDDLDPKMGFVTESTIINGADIHSEASIELVEAIKTGDIISTNILEPNENADDEISSLKDLGVKEDTVAKELSSTDDLQIKLVVEAKDVGYIDAQPSTSNLLQELSDEDQVTDSLGLLAESSRVMDDDDEQEQEQEQEDDDDDDDFDQDDESNQMTAEHSEDSNAQHSETDAQQESMDVEHTTNTDKGTFKCQIAEVAGSEIAGADIPVAEETTESMETEMETAVQALISSNVAEDTTDAQPEVASESDKLSNEDCSGVESEDAEGKLRKLLTRDIDEVKISNEEQSPSKTKNLEISKPKHEYNIVELEESSSEDDVQEVNKPSDAGSVTCVNIPAAVDVIAASAGQMSQIIQGERELLISVPKPPPQKPARLNTSEVTIKTTVTAAEPLVIPDAAAPSENDKQSSPFDLEVFNLDSDDDEKDKATKKTDERENKCINVFCTSDSTVPRAICDAAAAAYYGGARRGAVCTPCAHAVVARTQSLIEGVRDFTPLLSLDMGQVREELVEISDSDSEEEPDLVKKPEDAIGELTAKFLEENLEDMFNETWRKYNLESRLQEAQTQLNLEVCQLEAECKDIDTMLGECQVATDKLRRDLYDTFAHERKELPAILIYDTPLNMWSGLEDGILAYEKQETRQSKRRLQATTEPPPKRAAIPLGYTPLDSDANKTKESKEAKKAPASNIDSAVPNDDDSADISVVKLSAEAAPAGLPPPGAASRPPLRANMPVYAMRNAFGAWLRAKVVDVQPKTAGQFTMCRVKFEHKVKNPCKLLPARCLAYDQPSHVRMIIGTRVIALFADTQTTTKSYYSGIIAEIPNPVNNYRYLVFFDDGYAQYVQHANTRLVCECAPLVWDEVHPFSRNFVRDYLRAYPERPMVRAHPGQSLKTEWNGKWWVSKVIKVDASLVQVHFEEDNRTEWIYRGSTRLAPLYLELQAAERQRARPLPRAGPGRKVNMPYVEYTRSDEPAPPAVAQAEQDMRRQRAVAKKSTALPAPPAPAALDGVSSRVVFYTPKNAIRPLKMVPHTCGARCRRSDVLALKDLRTYNPLTKPLLSGWERQIVKYRFTKSVMYRAPCGRRIRDYRELHRYLQLTGSDMGVDLFDFGPHTHCLAEFVLNKCLVSKKDLSHGKENVPVPCVNYYDSSLPEFCSYNTERTPTAGVPLNLDPEFLCGCDCTDDCADKMKCACWKMTLEGARTIGLDSDVGYVYKRLPEPLPSGIYECNSRCKCRQTCLNRVAQHPLQLKLQVFKTLNRGWGIRALNDVPKGAFLCVYAGNLLTDATANLDGLNEGDEYLAELDYIEVVEQMKEGFEEDIPEADKKLDKDDSEQSSSPSSSSEDEEDPKQDDEDDDFRPAERLLRSAVPEYSKRLRKREKKKKEGDNKEKKDKQKEKEGNSEDNCITISDDEELREPSRFEAQAGMGGKEFISKYKSVRAHFGKDEACYIMDAKVQGNIGRYLNHSCTPNVFVQNVFVDTHDPRFPWVAFFALAHIRAGTELTWNYNYDVGSVPGKILYCHCAAPNCRGRLL